MRKKLAIITTHPIQYYAPLFRLLAQSPSLHIKVFYTWNRTNTHTYDPGFGKAVEWDIPLLEGYEYTFVNNVSVKPDSSYFRGIVNPTLNQEITIWGAEAVLVFGWSYQSHLQALCYFKGKVPVYFRGDSHLLDEKPGLKTFARRVFLHWVYGHVDYALYVGGNNKQYYLAHGLQEKQLLFAPHAIDNTRFAADVDTFDQRAAEWLKELGVAPTDIVFLYAGKLEPKKNPLLLLQVFMQLATNNTHLIFVGNGVLEEELKQASHTYNNIHFIDFQNQSQMPVVYRLGDVLVLPSQGPGETWGLVVNEAMACGLPVLVSDKVGCAIDLVKPGYNGYIFQSGNRLDLIEKMKLILKSKAKLSEMGKQSFQIIKDYSLEVLSDRIIQALFSAKNDFIYAERE